MNKMICPLFWLSVILCAHNINAQLLKTDSTTATQDSMINEAIKLHDNKEYDQAIKVFLKILKINPTNVYAMSELAMTYYAKNDFKNSEKYARMGTKYNSPYAFHCFLTLGSLLDNQGKSDDAIAAYKNGIKIYDKSFGLYFNLGLAYSRRSMNDSAKQSLHKALECNPYHPTSNLLLGTIYESQNKRIPAIFAYSRFLFLEPLSNRSQLALNQLMPLLSESLSYTYGDNDTIKMKLLIDTGIVDGDLTSLELALATVQTARRSDSLINSNDFNKIIHDYKSLFQITLELSQDTTYQGFVWNYYAPFFIDIQRNQLTEPFLYYIFSSQNMDRSKLWFDNHSEKAHMFKVWLNNYKQTN